jgi:FkbM family methyltransferase
MRKSTTRQLKKYPFLFSLLRKGYRTLFPIPPVPYTQIQKEILKNVKPQSPVFFVQVGSNDGMQGDPLHNIVVRNKNWRGIFIEPVGYLFERLKRNYRNSGRFIFEKKAIAPSSGTAEFFWVSEKAKADLGDALPYWYDQLGSFDKNNILRPLGGMLEPYIQSEKIKTIPLQGILDKYKVPKVDLLHIDAEGYDYKVLSTFDLSIYKPSVILYEHKHLSDIERNAAESLLGINGYACVEYGGDTLATISDGLD